MKPDTELRDLQTGWIVFTPAPPGRRFNLFRKFAVAALGPERAMQVLRELHGHHRLRTSTHR